jgi:hypothetical protein
MNDKIINLVAIFCFHPHPTYRGGMIKDFEYWKDYFRDNPINTGNYRLLKLREKYGNK